MALDISTPCYFVTLEIEEIYGRLKLASSHYLYLALNERFDFSAVLILMEKCLTLKGCSDQPFHLPHSDLSLVPK